MRHLLLLPLLCAAPASALAPLRAPSRPLPLFAPSLALRDAPALGAYPLAPAAVPALGGSLLPTTSALSAAFAAAPADGPLRLADLGRFRAAVPPWFEASGLAFTLVRPDSDGFAFAILRRGRFELAVYLDSRRGEQAIFTQHALNPMGTPRTETIGLLEGPTRRAVADLLRRAPAPDDAAGQAALAAMLARLEASR